MSQEMWAAVDVYLEEHLIVQDAAQERIYGANAAAGLPAQDVSATQGKFLNLLVRLRGAKRVLEIGTLGGYSTIWMGRALPPEGKIVTLELKQHHADVARANIDAANLACTVEIRVGNAVDSLQQLIAEGSEPFDLIFIDAHKSDNPAYLTASLALSRPGTVIVADNVVRDGRVLDPNAPGSDIQGVQKFFQMFVGNERLDATVLQTVGNKGWDGFLLALVK